MQCRELVKVWDYKNMTAIERKDPHVVISNYERIDLEQELVDEATLINDLMIDLPLLIRHKVIVNLLVLGIDVNEEIALICNF